MVEILGTAPELIPDPTVLRLRCAVDQGSVYDCDCDNLSLDLIYVILYNPSMKKIKKEKPITSDLFEIEECLNCDGSGQVSVEGKEHEERTEDCDICNYHK